MRFLALRHGARGVIRPLLRIGERWYAALDSAIPEHVPHAEDGDAVLTFADLVLNLRTREVFRGRRLIELTRTEFKLLELFLRNPRQVLTREVIFDRVWGFDFGPRSNTLSVYVGYVRRKTEAGGEKRIIHTVRGVGYMLRD